VVIFLWAYTVLPDKELRAPFTARLHGSIIAAAAFEILRYAPFVVVPGYASNGPTAAIFGPVIAVLFFLHLLSQMMLFIAAWIATADDGQTSNGGAGRGHRGHVDRLQGPFDDHTAAACSASAQRSEGLPTRSNDEPHHDPGHRRQERGASGSTTGRSRGGIMSAITSPQHRLRRAQRAAT
jgi:hypothetical protein